MADHTEWSQVVTSVFTQELLVLSVFAFSYALWRGLGQRRAKAGISKRNDATVDAQADSVKHSIQISPGGARHRQSNLDSPTDHIVDPSIKSVEQQMLRHLEHREFTRALNLYRNLERDGRDRQFSETLFSSFIQSAIRVGKVDVVERMLRTMKRSKMTPTFQFWQTTLKMLSSRRHFSACLSVYTLFNKQLPLDKVVFSCMINAALEMGAPEKAMLMLDQYGNCGIEAKDHVLYFRTYVALNDVDAAVAVFNKLGDEIVTLMLNLLLLTCVNSKQPQRALELLREANVRDARRKAKRKAEGDPDDGGSIADVVSYNTVIKGFAQAGQPTSCFDCLHEMLQRDLEPDDITFGTLLDACIVDNNIGAANEIVSLLADRDRPMDTVMCTLFMKGLVRAGCLPEALELYEEMRRRQGTTPDIITYSVLIKALVDQHDLERALRLLADMTAAGLKPDDIILTHLLEGCRHAGNHELGKKLFEDLLAAGVQPSDFTLVTMLKLHGRCGAHHEAYSLVANWELEHGEKPSVIHYTCIMSGCLRTKHYDQAWAAYSLMRDSGVQPDETTVATLLPGLVAAQHWDRALELVSYALAGSSPVATPAETLNNALSQMLAAGVRRHAEQLRMLMRNAGVCVTARNEKRCASV